MISYYENSISCFLVDIGTISKILQKSLDGSSSLSGARLFLKFQTLEIQNVEICRNNNFKDVPILFLVFFEASLHKIRRMGRSILGERFGSSTNVQKILGYVPKP